MVDLTKENEFLKDRTENLKDQIEILEDMKENLEDQIKLLEIQRDEENEESKEEEENEKLEIFKEILKRGEKRENLEAQRKKREDLKKGTEKTREQLTLAKKEKQTKKSFMNTVIIYGLIPVLIHHFFT